MTIPDAHHVDIHSENDVSLVYACVTMWHETREEMMQLLQSIKRLDMASANSGNKSEKRYYKLQAHIFLDDAFTTALCGGKILNDYARQLIGLINSFQGLSNFTMSSTPYGGRLSWVLPGGSPLVVHLKNCDVIRKKKRWSQVMYMHYLLRWLPEHENAPLSENTFILTLDGDVHFEPESIQFLVDDLRSNKDVAAACGRIHPIGSGLMASYQKFEYALGHWVNKETETVIGCILCTPGCFSMFRATAIAHSAILGQYEKITTNATHYLQRDQGEDRWLCTLLLQHGHRVVYNSSAKAHTFCPENIEELYKQRRRWTPTNLPNNMALLYNWRETMASNKHMSGIFVIYTMLLTAQMAIDTGCIFLLVTSALAGFTHPVAAVILNFLVLAVYCIICLSASQHIQMLATKFLTVIYAVQQVGLVFIIFSRLHNNDTASLSTIYLLVVAGIVFLAVLVHPFECKDLPHGVMFFLLAPSIRLLLMIYVVTNLHVVSWGTRESNTECQNVDTGRKQRYLQSILYHKILRYFRKVTKHYINLDEKQIMKLDLPIVGSEVKYHNADVRVITTNGGESWTEDLLLADAKMESLNNKESHYLERLCKDHLWPINEAELYSGFNLKRLRNRVTLAFWVINGSFVFIVVAIQMQSSHIQFHLFNSIKMDVEPISFILFLSFLSTTLTQVICMLIYRAQVLSKKIRSNLKFNKL